MEELRAVSPEHLLEGGVVAPASCCSQPCTRAVLHCGWLLNSVSVLGVIPVWAANPPRAPRSGGLRLGSGKGPQGCVPLGNPRKADSLGPGWGWCMGTVTAWGRGSCGIWLLMAAVLPRGNQATVGAPGQHRLLDKELRELQVAERQLDDLIQMCTVQLRLLTEDPANQQYPLVWGRGGAGWVGGHGGAPG